MAQRAFDHWFSTLADPMYADRCRRKNKLRKRKLPTGNYQIDEDVWARHPIDEVMYIASVIAVNSSHDACRVTFVNDGQTFSLPVSHLRHVTLEDIQCNRYVDYRRGWTERTRSGTIVTYNRYGEQQHVQYTVTPQDVFNCFLATEEGNCIDNDTVDATTSSSSVIEIKNDIPETEPIWIRVFDPADPTVTYRTCPIWNATSTAEAEKQALKLCNQDIQYKEAVQRAQRCMEKSEQLDSAHLEKLDSLQSQEHLAAVDNQPIKDCSHTSKKELIWVRIPDPEDPSATFATCPIWGASSYAEAEKQAFELANQDIEYTKAVQQVQYRIKAVQQLVPLHLQELNSSQPHETLAQTEDQLIESSSQIPSTESNTSKEKYDVTVDKSADELFDQQLFFDQAQDDKQQSSMSITASTDFFSAKEVGTQTEPFTSLPIVPIDGSRESIVTSYSNQSTKYGQTSTMNKKKRTVSSSSKYHWPIRENISSTVISGIDKRYKFWSRFGFDKSFTAGFTKSLPYIVLAIMIIYHLLFGATMTNKDVNSPTSTKIHMIPIDVIQHQSAMALFVSSMLTSFSSINGPSQSMFELWPYPFTVP